MRHRLHLVGLVALLVGLAGQQLVFAAPRALTHDRVLQDVREKGQAQVIVTLDDGRLPQARAADWRQRVPAIRDMRDRVMRDAPKFTVRRTYVTQPLIAGAVTDESLKQLQRSPVVTGIYPNRKFKIALKESGPLIGQPEAQTAGYTGQGVAVAIVDTGIDYKHADFGGNANTTINLPPPATTNSTKVVGGYDFVNNDTDPMDDNGHGTHVSGIVAGMDSVYRGIAPDATLVAYKAVDKDGYADTAAIAAAMDRVIQDQAAYNIKVVNLSLSDGLAWTSDAEFRSYYPDEAAVYDNVAAQGIVIVAASGNEGYTDGIGSPAILSSVISVGATYDQTFATTQNWGDCKDATPVVDSPVCFSNRGELTDLYAPGAYITSAKASQSTDPSRPGDPAGFITEAGTSSASPHVAGAAACAINILYADPTAPIDPAAVRRRLKLTGSQVFDSATHVATPRVDLVGAMHPRASGPDLTVTAVSTTATSAFVGDSVPVSITITNQGDAASPACSAIVVLSSNSVISPQDFVLATVDVPSLTAGQSSTQTATGTVPGMPSGMFTLGGFADSSYIVEETDETNNGFGGGQLPVGSSASVAGTDIPAFMLKGHSYTINISMRNDSPAPWTTSEGYELTAVSPIGTTRWGTVDVPLPGGVTVNPTETVTFTFNVTAPVTAAWVPCHWQMAKNGHAFGEVATGATNTQVTDDLTMGQDYPAVSGDRVAYQDNRDADPYGLGEISVTDLTTNLLAATLPRDIPFPLDAQGYPLPPFEWTTDPLNLELFPDISGPWVSWMTDDVPDPSDSYLWYFQVLSYNLDTPHTLPARVNYNAAHPSDQMFPSVDGHLMVYEDYRSDPNRLAGDGMNDNADIYIADLSAAVDSNYTVPTYPICIAPGPQVNPRISGDIVVWQDYRDLTQADIYMYDLSVDTGNTGVPNWKRPPSSRPNPDPAETRLTNTPYDEMAPDVSGRTVVWMDLRRFADAVASVDIYALDLDTMTETPVVTNPPTIRIQPRIDNRKVVWTDYRLGQADIYWEDLDTGLVFPLAAGQTEDDVADISGNRVAWSKMRDTGVYNIFAQQLLTNASVGVHTFTDVDDSYWAWKWIEAVAGKGVALGYSDGTYGPAIEVTRDQMAVYVARALEGGDSLVPDGPATASFSDVPTNYWAYKYIQDCVTKGVVQGYSDGTYKPATVVTRDAMAVFIARAVAGGDAQVTGAATPSFSDVSTTQWAFKYIEYCADPGRHIVKGFEDGTYRPGDPVTRDQMAVYIARAFKYTSD